MATPKIIKNPVTPSVPDSDVSISVISIATPETSTTFGPTMHSYAFDVSPNATVAAEVRLNDELHGWYVEAGDAGIDVWLASVCDGKARFIISNGPAQHHLVLHWH